jgi:hypothetical protein
MIPGGRTAPTAADLAIGACRVTRYAGALWMPLSVHSILVADLCWLASREDVDWVLGLFHDLHETVTGEVVRHWKPPEMRTFEAEIDRRIFRAFHLDLDLYRRRADFVKAADEKALAAEATMLGLPGWPGFYERETGAPPPILGSEERTIAASLFGSAWMRPEAIRSDSASVGAFTDALHLVRAGEFRRARQRIGGVV